MIVPGAFRVQLIDPVTDPAWQDLLAACPTACLFHSPLWMRSIAEGYGFQINAYLATTASGDLAGAAAFSQIDDFIGSRIVSLPFSDACDPLLRSPDSWKALLAALQSHRMALHLRWLSESRIAPERMDLLKTASWHRLRIDDATEQELWARLSPEARRAIRQSERAGLAVRPLAGGSDHAAFHQLHVALRKSKYRLLAQPPHFFAALERHFTAAGAWHSLAAWIGSQMAAGTIYLRWGDTLYYKFNASAADALWARPNNRLLWEGIRLAKSLGCRYLDLGPSDNDQPGLVRFKRNVGAERLELRFLRWTPPNWKESSEPRQVLSDFTRRLTDPAIADGVAAQAGSAFYRFFA